MKRNFMYVSTYFFNCNVVLKCSFKLCSWYVQFIPFLLLCFQLYQYEHHFECNSLYTRSAAIQEHRDKILPRSTVEQQFLIRLQILTEHQIYSRYSVQEQRCNPLTSSNKCHQNLFVSQCCTINILFGVLCFNKMTMYNINTILIVYKLLKLFIKKIVFSETERKSYLPNLKLFKNICGIHMQ